MPSIYALLVLLSAPASTQIVGGGSELLHQWDGGFDFHYLGDSVSDAGDVNGDGFADVIVGAPEASPGGLTSAGAAYVYSGADGSILYQWDGTIMDGHLGSSVSGAGDVNGDGFPDFAVGAIGIDFSVLTEAGSVYVYSGMDGSLLYQWFGRSSFSAFGQSVSDAGDVNSDGFADVIVGAPLFSAGGAGPGAVYVYSGVDGTLLYLWLGRAAGDNFGFSVSGAGDINADGFTDLLVGAFAADPGGLAESGSVYAYSGADGSLLYQWDGVDLGLQFGESVSDAGDLNGDGFADVIIGQLFGVSGGLSPVGAAYAYSGADGSLLYRWGGGAINDRFGDSVSGVGDLDGDGFADVIIGAPGVVSGGMVEAGAAYVYSGADGSLLQQWEGETGGAFFGRSVSGAGDVNADGFADVIVGAPFHSFGGLVRPGSAYVYSFHPFLTANTSAISTSAGGVLDLTLNFPDNPLDYIVLMSVNGTGPIFYGVEIPLSLDSFLIDSANGIYPFSTTSNLHGTLDASGNASASITIPAGAFNFAVGHTFWMAAVSFPTGQLPVHSSVSVAVEFLP